MSIATRTDSALARIAIVTHKEIADLFRDRRTMIVTVITAMAAGPVLMLLVMNRVNLVLHRSRNKPHRAMLLVVGVMLPLLLTILLHLLIMLRVGVLLLTNRLHHSLLDGKQVLLILLLLVALNPLQTKTRRVRLA
jgi:hypothetical protein